MPTSDRAGVQDTGYGGLSDRPGHGGPGPGCGTRGSASGGIAFLAPEGSHKYSGVAKFDSHSPRKAGVFHCSNR